MTETQLKEPEVTLSSLNRAVEEIGKKLRCVESLQSRIDELNSANIEANSRLKHLETSLHSRLNELDSAIFETKNRLIHADTNLHSRINEIGSAIFETENRLINLDTSVHSRFNEILSTHLPGILEQLHGACALLLHEGDHPQSSRKQRLPVVRDTLQLWLKRSQQFVGERRGNADKLESFDNVLAQAQRDFPSVFAAWKERLDEIQKDFAITKAGNAANAADVYSQLFRKFVSRYAEGSVLDVGCGPFGKPFYLSSYPSHLVAGIDPLAVQLSDEMELVQGISEYLPWATNSFSTVVSATSLDHCISLDKSLNEIVRVLRPNGKFLLWLGSIPGAPPYRPQDHNYTPADRFHLFHFDIVWLEPMLESHFRVIDRVKLDRLGYSHVFYCLQLAD